MKKGYLILLIAAFGITACLKNDKFECKPVEVTITAPASEVNNLKGYLTGNNITATEDQRGFFYNITTQGTGAKPTNCSSVTIDYVAKLTNGNTVDSNNNVTFGVSQFITGWQEALPLLAAGGSMTLYLPPSLAYGSSGSGSVPPNANMIFSINLKTVY